MEFNWHAGNVEHIARHGVTPEEIEFLIASASPPYPKYQGDGRYLVRGQTAAGAYLQAVFIYDKDDGRIYVTHARPLTQKERHAFRRRRR